MLCYYNSAIGGGGGGRIAAINTTYGTAQRISWFRKVAIIVSIAIIFLVAMIDNHWMNYLFHYNNAKSSSESSQQLRGKQNSETVLSSSSPIVYSTTATVSTQSQRLLRGPSRMRWFSNDEE
jgi:hypothetical protein